MTDFLSVADVVAIHTDQIECFGGAAMLIRRTSSLKLSLRGGMRMAALTIQAKHSTTPGPRITGLARGVAGA